MTMRARDFQEPLMNTLYALTAGDLNNHVYHKDVYDRVCAEMGIDPNGFGQMKDGKLKTHQWIQWAYKNLKRTGMVADVGKGRWALSNKGVSFLGNSASVTSTVQATASTPTKVVEESAAPITAGPPVVAISASGYHADPYFVSLAASKTPCFGYHSQKSTTCGRCPLATECKGMFFVTVASLAEKLRIEDQEAARVAAEKAEAKRAAEEAEKAKPAAEKTKAKAKADGDWDWDAWDMDSAKSIIARAESKCPRCGKSIQKDDKAVWIRSKANKDGRRYSVMFHTGCVD